MTKLLLLADWWYPGLYEGGSVKALVGLPKDVAPGIGEAGASGIDDELEGTPGALVCDDEDIVRVCASIGDIGTVW